MRFNRLTAFASLLAMLACPSIVVAAENPPLAPVRWHIECQELWHGTKEDDWTAWEGHRSAQRIVSATYSIRPDDGRLFKDTDTIKAILNYLKADSVRRCKSNLGPQATVPDTFLIVIKSKTGAYLVAFQGQETAGPRPQRVGPDAWWIRENKLFSAWEREEKRRLAAEAKVFAEQEAKALVEKQLKALREANGKFVGTTLNLTSMTASQFFALAIRNGSTINSAIAAHLGYTHMDPFEQNRYGDALTKDITHELPKDITHELHEFWQEPIRLLLPLRESSLGTMTFHEES